MYSEHGVSHTPFLISFFPPFFPVESFEFHSEIRSSLRIAVNWFLPQGILLFLSKYSKEEERKKKEENKHEILVHLLRFREY